uniref:peptidylprolyl isomerase n=1 Tax=Neobodo designis TaxID=312471 RepID=A0A7S1LN17_NEODS
MRAIATAALVALLLLAATAAAGDMTKYYKRTGAKFLSTKEAEEGVYKLPSGMLFKILEKGTGATSPRVADPCEVHYEGTLPNGNVFDSSFKRGSPSSFAPNQVIKGWTEALQLMREGDKWEVYIPHELAYGARGAGGVIPGYAALTFKMQLLKVKSGGKPAAEADAAIQEKLGKAYADL